MKSIFLVVINFVGKVVGFLFPLKLSYTLKILLNKFYTGYVGNNFKRIGINCTIDCSSYLYGSKYIELGDNVTICKNVDLTAWDYQNGLSYTPFIKIGNNVSIGKNAHITSTNEIVIGDNTLLGKFVTITDNSHGNTDFNSLQTSPSKRPLISAGGVKIGKNVWIGDKVTILPGVTIGDNTIIGANSVVVKNIPHNSVAVGIPAKLIKNYDNEKKG